MISSNSQYIIYAISLCCLKQLNKDGLVDSVPTPTHTTNYGKQEKKIIHTCNRGIPPNEIVQSENISRPTIK